MNPQPISLDLQDLAVLVAASERKYRTPRDVAERAAQLLNDKGLDLVLVSRFSRLQSLALVGQELSGGPCLLTKSGAAEVRRVMRTLGEICGIASCTLPFAT